MYLSEIPEEHFTLPATRRHYRIVSAIEGNLIGFAYDERFFLSREAVSLVHYGSDKARGEYNQLALVDIESLDDMDRFRTRTMNDLYCVEPDVMLFVKNGFIGNITETRVAGQPDLIVEVWSDSNTLINRQMKFDLYKTGTLTEHWYIEQDSNTIRCFIGEKRIEDKDMRQVMHTKDNIKIDIRQVAIG